MIDWKIDVQECQPYPNDPDRRPRLELEVHVQLRSRRDLARIVKLLTDACTVELEPAPEEKT